MEEDPDYDYPDTSLCRKPVLRASLTKISILDRLLLTHQVWHQPTINSATALHILQRELPGSFLVRKSNTWQKKVLCVRLADDSVPSFVAHVYIREQTSTFSLQGSAVSFPDLFRLLSFYCVSRDVLPFTLKLPDAIMKATSQKELEAISHLGVEFWSSSLNAKDPQIGPYVEPPSPPEAEEVECATPQLSVFSQFCPLKTRSPLELDCGSGNGALCFINPLFMVEHTSIKRNKFKRSFKIRVSTETTGSLSPPSDPPPPVPVEKPKDLKGQESSTQKPNEDSDYMRPQLVPKMRQLTKASKACLDNGFKVSTLSPTEEEDYQTPRLLGTTQAPQEDAPSQSLVSPVANEGSSQRLSNLSASSSSSSTDSETLDLEYTRAPSLEEMDSGSLSSLDESEDADQASRPQLKRMQSSPVKQGGRSPFRKMSDVFYSFLSPEKRVLKVVEEMAQDRRTSFGCLVQDFLTLTREQKDTLSSSTDLLQTIRQFMTQMKSYLLQSSELELPIETLIPMDEQDFVLEKAMHRCILKPLKSHIDSCMKASATRDGSLQLLSSNLQLARESGPAGLELRVGMPAAAEMEKIKQKFVLMQKSFSPTDKVVLLLQACKKIYSAMKGNSGRGGIPTAQ
nr:PREDICTED: ras and Rab interactor 1 [Latimeria chalumnae]|eukprot:XP_006002526.1 PREDICTED: ras and Rab interactor 1 [Latimeria chalumnae]